MLTFAFKCVFPCYEISRKNNGFEPNSGKDCIGINLLMNLATNTKRGLSLILGGKWGTEYSNTSPFSSAYLKK